MTDEPRSVGRRHAIAGAAGLAVAAPALAACGGDEESGPTGEPGDVLTPTADVPVGGGTVLSDQKVVVTQPSEGDFKAFTAVCTHEGCLVGQVADGTIQCPCHGSQFSIADGSVSNGPASSPLEEIAITVEGDSISLS